MKLLARLLSAAGLVLLVVALIQQPSPEPYLLLGILAVALGLVLTVARRRPAGPAADDSGTHDNPYEARQR